MTSLTRQHVHVNHERLKSSLLLLAEWTFEGEPADLCSMSARVLLKSDKSSLTYGALYDDTEGSSACSRSV